MNPLRPAVLAGIAVVSGVLSWAGSRLWDSTGTLPGVPVAAPVVLFLIAAVLLATALSLRSRLLQQRDRMPGAQGVDPLVAARAVVFGQASGLVAALVAGVYGGMGAFLLGSSDTARRDDVLLAGVAVLGAAAVVLAALLVQRVLRLPDDDEQAGDTGGG